MSGLQLLRYTTGRRYLVCTETTRYVVPVLLQVHFIRLLSAYSGTKEERVITLVRHADDADCVYAVLRNVRTCRLLRLQNPTAVVAETRSLFWTISTLEESRLCYSGERALKPVAPSLPYIPMSQYV